MTTAAWVTLVGAWLAGLVSPGPDFIAVLRASVVSGRRAGSMVALGIASVLVLWLSLALSGVSVVLLRHDTAYRAVRVAGALVLLCYGTWILWQVVRSRMRLGSAATDGATGAADDGTEGPGTGVRGRGDADWFRLGAVTNASNPKAVGFFAALFATLLPPAATVPERGLLLVLFVGSALGWFLLVARLASAGPLVAAYRRSGWVIDAVLGGLLVLIGAALLPR